jgi:hypothetical protein
VEGGAYRVSLSGTQRPRATKASEVCETTNTPEPLIWLAIIAFSPIIAGSIDSGNLGQFPGTGAGLANDAKGPPYNSSITTAPDVIFMTDLL